MSKGRSFAAMLIVAGGLSVVAAAPARAVQCGSYSPAPDYSGLSDLSKETAEQREARAAKRLADREARKAARAAKKVARENAAAAPAAPTTVASN